MLYFLYLVLLFAFLYFNTSAVSLWLNYRQTSYLLDALAVFLTPGEIKGVDIWINPHYKIIITQACNGLIPIFFLWAAILAYPSRWLHKISWLFISYLILFLANILRLLLVVYFVKQTGGQANFFWAHDLMGNALLIIVGLGLFIAFIKTSKTPSPQ